MPLKIDTTLHSLRPLRRFVLGLGSNLGDRRAILQGAVDALCRAPELVVDGVSPVYESEPWGPIAQDDFLNLVVEGETMLKPGELLDLTSEIENAFGRNREVRWGPRTLDIDIVTLGDAVVDTERITLPHPRAFERSFVLVPWLDLDPAAELPGLGRVADLAAATDRGAVRRRDDLALAFVGPGGA